MVFVNHSCLPQCIEEQQGREEKCYDGTGQHHNTEGDDNKSYGNQWIVDAVGIMCL